MKRLVSMRRPALLFVSAAVAAFAMALALPAAATSAEDLAAKREKWVTAYQELKQKHVQIDTELKQARQDYSRGRSTKHLRGEGKAGLLDEIKRLEEEFASVDQELQALPDKARADGAYPGWFRDLDEPAATQPAASAANEIDNEDADDADAPSRAEKRAAERNRRRPGGR